MRIREYTEVEVYKGYDDAHNTNNEISQSDIVAADKLYAQIMRFHKETAGLLVHSELIKESLRRVENIELGSVSEQEWTHLATSIEDSLASFLSIRGVGLAVATKLLHLKRPKLFPILDSYAVSFLLGKQIAGRVAFASSKAVVLRFGMEALKIARSDLRRNHEEFDALSRSLSDLPVALEKARLYDILCWTTEKWNIRKILSAPYGIPKRSLPLAERGS